MAAGIQDEDDWSDRVYDLSFKNISRRIRVQERKQKSLGGVVDGVGLALCSSILGHQLLNLFQRKKQPLEQGRSSFLSKKNLRATEYSFSLFGGKVILDHFSQVFRWDLTQYQKGNILGLLCYILNRPLDQLQLARREILLSQKKTINRLQALKVVLLYDGWRGLYKNENLLAPISATLHRGIYFGLYYRLSHNFSSAQSFSPFHFTIFPFVAAFGASLSTFLLDKLRSGYLHVHHLRNTAITRRGKNWVEDQSVSKQVVRMIGNGEIKVGKGDLQAVTVAIVKNWIMLSFFVIGQHYGGSIMKQFISGRVVEVKRQ